jgi:hypothetical protein
VRLGVHAATHAGADEQLLRSLALNDPTDLSAVVRASCADAIARLFPCHTPSLDALIRAMREDREEGTREACALALGQALATWPALDKEGERATERGAQAIMFAVSSRAISRQVGLKALAALGPRVPLAARFLARTALGEGEAEGALALAAMKGSAAVDELIAWLGPIKADAGPRRAGLVMDGAVLGRLEGHFEGFGDGLEVRWAAVTEPTKADAGVRAACAEALGGLDLKDWEGAERVARGLMGRLRDDPDDQVTNGGESEKGAWGRVG